MNYYTTHYKEIKRLKTKGLRGYARDIVLESLSLINNFVDTEKNLRKPKIQFLYIHHVFEDEEQNLRNLLNVLHKYYKFITYSEAVEKIRNCEIDNSYLVISSDDGFKNNLSAANIFSEYGIRATFFINPGIINNSNYDFVTHHCRSRLNLPPVEFLEWKDIDYMQKMGHEIGGHTMYHINIAKSQPQQVINDMVECYEIIKKRCGEAKHFAFPYGRLSDFTETGKKACFDVGYISCATAERGCHINHNRKLDYEEICILRDHVILDWKLDHIMYFLYNSAKSAKQSNNIFPN